MTASTVRPLEAADRDQWDVLWQGYLTFYECDDLSPATTEATWQRVSSGTGPLFGMAAVDDGVHHDGVDNSGVDNNGGGRLLGIVHYLIHPVTWSARPRCYLEDLFVADEARGQGVGRALMEAVFAAANAVPCDQVYWVTQAGNATARRLYDDVASLTDMVQYKRPCDG